MAVLSGNDELLHEVEQTMVPIRNPRSHFISVFGDPGTNFEFWFATKFRALWERAFRQ
jgi:hypothetical protein